MEKHWARGKETRGSGRMNLDYIGETKTIALSDGHQDDPGTLGPT